jgi:hypothetical protein
MQDVILIIYVFVSLPLIAIVGKAIALPSHHATGTGTVLGFTLTLLSPFNALIYDYYQFTIHGRIVLPEKLNRIGAELVKKLPTFFGNLMFITTCTTATTEPY